MMLLQRFTDHQGQLAPARPTFGSFRCYFYSRNYHKSPRKIIARDGLTHYQRNCQPAFGTASAWRKFPGSFQMDATEADIYLLSDSGAPFRPYIYLAVDSATQLIAGVWAGEECDEMSVMRCLENACQDKVEWCGRHDITITEEQWPSHGLPYEVITDKGREFCGARMQELCRRYGVELISQAPFRPDRKGLVEQAFHLLQERYKPLLRGKGVIEPDAQERWAVDYRGQAVLTLEDFTQVLIHCIVYLNSGRMLSSGRTPAQLWAESTPQLLDVDAKELRLMALPRTTAKLTRAAMPEMLAHSAFMAAVRSLPPLPAGLGAMTPEERRQHLPMLSSLFIPMDYTYVLYDQLFRALSSTYSTRTMLEEIRRTNALFRGAPVYSTQPATGSILGVPGVGKTSSIRRALSLLPQVIEHEEYLGKPFFCKQVLYLNVKCPSNCSVKALALNIMTALDKAAGSSYLQQFVSLRSAASALATQVKILCLTFHVGLILIDEIQNAVATAEKNRQVKPLIKFLVELTNDTCTSVFFVGTPIAEGLFTSQEHLKRRTRGMRLLPFKPDGAYRAFLQAIWPYQLTSATAPLSEQLANKLYGHSGGNPGLHREDIPGIPSAGPASRGELHLRQDDAAGH